MKGIIVVVLAIALTGCGSPVNMMVRPTASTTDAQVKMDRAQCDAQGASAAAGVRNPIEAGFTEAKVGSLCMAGKGYRYVKISEATANDVPVDKRP